MTTGDGEATLHDVRIRPSGGSANTGIDIGDTAQLRLLRGTVSGSTTGILYDSATDGFVSQSTIFSGVSGTGDLTCIASDNGLGSALEDDCSVAP